MSKLTWREVGQMGTRNLPKLLGKLAVHQAPFLVSFKFWLLKAGGRVRKRFTFRAACTSRIVHNMTASIPCLRQGLFAAMW